MGKPGDPSEGGSMAGTVQSLHSCWIGTFRTPLCPLHPRPVPLCFSALSESPASERRSFWGSLCTEGQTSGLFPLIPQHPLSPAECPHGAVSGLPYLRPLCLASSQASPGIDGGSCSSLLSGLPGSGLVPQISSPHCS